MIRHELHIFCIFQFRYNFKKVLEKSRVFLQAFVRESNKWQGYMAFLQILFHGKLGTKCRNLQVCRLCHMKDTELAIRPD